MDLYNSEDRFTFYLYLTHGSEVGLDVDSHLQKLQEAPHTKISGTEQELHHHGPGTSEGPGE